MTEAMSHGTLEVTKRSTYVNGIQIHYLIQGTGPLVICSHGFPDNALSFRSLVGELAEAGFTAVAPYLRGYAPTSTAPLDEYHTCYMAHDLLGLANSLGFKQAMLVGHDWGAQASIAAAILFPERINKLVTLGWSRPEWEQSLSYEYLKGIWHTFFFQSPIAEQALANNDFEFIERWWRDSSKNWDIPPATLESVKETFRSTGVLEAALAQYRCRYLPISDSNLKFEQERIKAGPVPVPTLLMHGTHDREGRLDAFYGNGVSDYFSSFMSRVVIEGAGHFLHREKPDEVNQKIIEFIKSDSSTVLEPVR